MDKAQLRKILKEAISEALEDVLTDVAEKEDVKQEKKQRFRRRRRKEQQKPTGINVNELDLAPDEQKELEQAAKDDKNIKHNRGYEQFMSKRPPYKKIEVRCMKCGRTEKVNPSFVYKDEEGYRYKCNRCSCTPG